MSVCVDKPKLKSKKRKANTDDDDDVIDFIQSSTKHGMSASTVQQILIMTIIL